MTPEQLTPILERAECHIFDVDHTLVRHSTGRRFVQEGYRRGIIPARYVAWLPWFYLRYRLGSLSLRDLTREITPLRGRTRTEIGELVDAAWNNRIKGDLYPDAVEYLARCRTRGATVVLASTSFDVILTPLAVHLNADETIASVLEFSEDAATGWIEDGPCYAERKAERIADVLARLAIPARTCAFYTDSHHDLSSLELVGYPVAVHPDALLRRIATRRAWPIVTW
ncbi:MAG: HAD family hydrolase [Alkalispirochaeta sp.]